MDDNQDHENEQQEENVADNNAAQEDEQEQEGGPERNEDGSLNGGVAVPPSEDGNSKSPSECDLMLFIDCMETLEDVAPNHSILQPGIVVAIGLDKSTKLSAVFQRFCDYLNEQYPSVTIEQKDFDFFHCNVLQGSDTAETAALMKNDHIEVRKNRKAEREADAEEYRVQREMDRDYFKAMRLLMPDTIGSKTCDVVLDCRGKLVDEKGLNQEVLRSDVRGHSSLLARRCKWLGTIIQNAREELERQSVVTVPEQESQGVDAAARLPAVDEDDGIEALPYALERNQDESNRAAAEIENDDDDEDGDAKMPAAASREESSDVSVSDVPEGGSPLWVTIPNHSPDAVRLLLEYCYTNRVVPLGQSAFAKACRTKGDRDRRNPLKPFSGPVAPYHNYSSRTRGWPNDGKPTITFAVALAGISLAEEADMPRLSLMCEVAASELVEPSNVVEALSRCTTQEKLTGNSLAILRQAAMSVLFENGERGVVDLCRTQSFKRALDEKTDASIVPSLLVGTTDLLTPEKKNKDPTVGTKRDLTLATTSAFDELDREDVYHRHLERRKRRAERTGDDGASSMYDDDDDWYLEAESPTHPLLKRSRRTFQVGHSSPSRRRSRRNLKRSGGRSPAY